jgi:hypothetical protein
VVFHLLPVRDRQEPVLSERLCEQMPVVCGDNDLADPKRSQTPYGPAQLVQDFIHVPTSFVLALGLLTAAVEFLRGH